MVTAYSQQDGEAAADSALQISAARPFRAAISIFKVATGGGLPAYCEVPLLLAAARRVPPRYLCQDACSKHLFL